MSDRLRLKLASVLFAVLWTAGMLWWTAPQGMAGIIIYMIAGAVAGFLWYWAFGKWQRWYLARLSRN